MVFAFEGDRIAGITGFTGSRTVPRFGLPTERALHGVPAMAGPCNPRQPCQTSASQHVPSEEERDSMDNHSRELTYPAVVCPPQDGEGHADEELTAVQILSVRMVARGRAGASARAPRRLTGACPAHRLTPVAAGGRSCRVTACAERGLCVGYDGGDAVSSEYTPKFEFTNGRIVKVVFDVGDDAYLDVEQHLAAALARDEPAPRRRQCAGPRRPVEERSGDEEPREQA